MNRGQGSMWVDFIIDLEDKNTLNRKLQRCTNTIVQ